MHPSSSNATARAALVVAVLALVAALGGSAYAAAAINGRNLVNRSVGGVKLANDTVTGAQVKESTLRGLVRPSALRGVARSADFRRVRMEVTTTSAVSRQVLALGSLRVSFSCESGDGTNAVLAGTSTSGRIGWDLGGWVQSTGLGTYDRVQGGVLEPGGPSQTLLNADAPRNGYFKTFGSLVLNNDARRETVLLTYAVYVDRTPERSYCNLVGTAQRSIA